ncbi:hypothetical protein F66182_4001 [Fusarium sp. NRRL 66182]|nr:hypothetical protein F66182_4001 [Fusarium sp. NRRL 66182]
MADQVNEKPEVEAPAANAQEVSATEEKPTGPASTEDGAAKVEGEGAKEDTKTIEETKESENPAEDMNATDEAKDDVKRADESADVEMKDATDAPAAEETKAESSVPSADGEKATENAATETPSAKGKNNNRRKSTGTANRKSLSKKASKTRLTHLDAKPGDHFLVKLKGFPAWPAIICDESMLPQALVDSRPVAAARPDGTYTEAYADGGKRVNDRSFPVMYLHTNEFGWVPNTSLTELTPEKASDTITEKMRKDLREAFLLAVEHNPIDHYKEVLKQFQDDLIAKQQAAATPKKSKKGKAKAADEDVDMEDVDDATADKSKSKKRKAEDDASVSIFVNTAGCYQVADQVKTQTPQRSDSVKKPKIKLNTSTPKAANGTPAVKDESATKAKVKVKKSSEKKADAPKEAKITPEQRRQRKEKEVLYLRHKLQRGLLTRDQQPQESEMKQMSEFVTMLENLKDLEVSIIRTTKINKVLKAILKLQTIPREDEFHFKDRSQALLDKWNKLMVDETAAPAPDATNGVNGKSEPKLEEKKDDSGKEDTEEPKAEETEKPKDVVEDTPEAPASEEKNDDKGQGEIDERRGGHMDVLIMTREAMKEDTYNQEDHQVAYIFGPLDDGSRQKPAKRRRVSKQAQDTENPAQDSSYFVPLLNGAELPEFVHLRETLFQESWAKVDERIEAILKTSNLETLQEVSDFVKDAEADCGDRIPSAFIITGPNIASQDLLFQQLSETLQQTTPSKFVGLRSSEASTLKATLKKIIRDVTAKASDQEDDDLQVGDGREGRRYLDYDLEALHAFIKPQSCEHVFVAFQDSEGFDSSLLSDLIILFNSWRPRTPFTLLFGIATSVELLQARLLKAACQQIYGAQFDVIQTSTILETIFKATVAAADAPVLLGPSLFRSMLDRQHDQYSYMCHLYANPLSVLEHASKLQPEHIEAIRHVGSFRKNVEEAVKSGVLDNVQYAKDLLEDDEFLISQVQTSLSHRHDFIEEFLRALLVVRGVEAQDFEFSRAYVEAIDEGISLTEHSQTVESIRRMGINELLAMLRRVISILRDGEDDLRLGPAAKQVDVEFRDALTRHLVNLEELHLKAREQGITLRTKYSGQSKVMRTTVIAQRVQLSHDSAALTDEDKQITQTVDDITALFITHIQVPKPSSLLLSETWLYDSRAPSRDVFVPRPRAVLERSLAKPHDYLSCSCCKPGDEGTPATFPATALLYRLYTETGSLINVADLWTAFSALVGDEEADERKSLVLFYRALAELRALGFVKASKKKADHIAKLKWL